MLDLVLLIGIVVLSLLTVLLFFMVDHVSLVVGAIFAAYCQETQEA